MRNQTNNVTMSVTVKNADSCNPNIEREMHCAWLVRIAQRHQYSRINPTEYL